LRPKIPFFQPTKHGTSPAQHAGKQAETMYVQCVQGSTTHQLVCTGGGVQQTTAGAQQTGAGAQQLGAPQSQASTMLGAETAKPTATAQLIKNFLNISISLF
jgi:hypothetical protein